MLATYEFDLVCMRHFLKLSCVERFFSILSVIELCLLLSACASVDTILLTSETFPPKGSADEVAVLEGNRLDPIKISRIYGSAIVGSASEVCSARS